MNSKNLFLVKHTISILVRFLNFSIILMSPSSILIVIFHLSDYLSQSKWRPNFSFQFILIREIVESVFKWNHDWTYHKDDSICKISFMSHNSSYIRLSENHRWKQFHFLLLDFSACFSTPERLCQRCLMTSSRELFIFICIHTTFPWIIQLILCFASRNVSIMMKLLVPCSSWVRRIRQ